MQRELSSFSLMPRAFRELTEEHPGRVPAFSPYLSPDRHLAVRTAHNEASPV